LVTLLQVGPQGLSQALPVTLLYLVLIVAFFYFFMIRPQQVQGRRRREMLAKLKKGDRIVTLGGLHATIHDVNSDHLTLELAPNVRVKADHSAVQAVRGRKDKE
jgi:preprotein translocase subunit YajC